MYGAFSIDNYEVYIRVDDPTPRHPINSLDQFDSYAFKLLHEGLVNQVAAEVTIRSRVVGIIQ